MDEELTYKVAIASDGQQIPIASNNGMAIAVYPAGEAVEKIVDLDVTSAEFEKVQQQAVTNDIPAAMLKKRAEAEPGQEDSI